MKATSLFPNRLKPFAWVIFILSLIFGILYITECIGEPKFLDVKVLALFNDAVFSLGEGDNFQWIITNNIADELIGIGLIVSGMILGFAKTKIEDEYIAYLRVKSLTWSFFLNYGILFFALIFVFGLSFFNVMLVSMFLSLVLFVLLFHYKLYQLNKRNKFEK